MSRIRKYIIVTLIIAYSLTVIGFREAFFERGYHAIGGEAFIPLLVCIISGCLYNRKEIIESLMPREEEEESGS